MLIYYYLIAFLMTITVGVILLRKNALLLKILSCVLLMFFVFRIMMGEDAVQNIIALEGYLSKNKILNFLAILLVWLTYSGNLLLILAPFFNIAKINKFIVFISLPVNILNLIFLKLHYSAIMGNEALNTISARGIIFALELGISLALSVFALIKYIKELKTTNKVSDNKIHTASYVYLKLNNNLTFKQKFFYTIKVYFENVALFFKKNWFNIFAVIVVLLSTMPAYALKGIFGFPHQIYKIKNFEIPHRIILYISLILPVIVHYSLKNRKFEERKFYLLFICLGTLLTFLLNYKFADFANPTAWPLHLCNTAMYIMPIVLIFKMKRFFYFTYFINVLGAFLAMLMPNYSDLVNIFDTNTVIFYVNHFIAFFMPLLFVSLEMFERPKFKQFLYSFVAFAGYFLLVLVINALFSGLYEIGAVSTTTDYFFINSDFVADKLGLWAENLRNITATLKVSNIQLIFYPVYQILFFFVYVLLGLGMWFIYEQGFLIANSMQDIKIRKEIIKVERMALMSNLNGRNKNQPVNPENSNKLILDNFSKKYGNSKVFAVKDANLTVNGGEIFGFLGPNGAGKSTIIKSIVGIQPITSGKIQVCGYDVASQSIQAKQQIGFVPDHYALYEKLTGREYVNYIADLYQVPQDERDQRLNDYITRFQLEGAIDNQIRTYSHGMKQKITIMSALVHNPKVWILDEPLTGLDPNSIFQVKECMKQHAKNGNIVFFSSHIIDVVEKICDKIAIIKKGNILLTKSVEEIEKDGVTLEEFYMSKINQDAE